MSTIRLQSGFFGSDALGYFEPALKRLAASNGTTRILLGSNDGETRRSHLADLLAIAGPTRSNLGLAVVSFANGFFHPKVIHLTRADGSATAYVGSANLTLAGVTSKHVEAGMILETRDGDAGNILESISDAIDSWFANSPPGFYPFSTTADLDALAAASVIDVSKPPRTTRTPSAPAAGQAKGTNAASLTPLVKAPAATKAQTQIPPPVIPTPPHLTPSPIPTPAITPALPPTTPTPAVVQTLPAATVVRHWSKTLSSSDAQRKGTGNQRGAVTLVQGDYRGRIDQRTFFRQVLFGSANWAASTTVTGLPSEIAVIPMEAIVLGVARGIQNFEVSYAANRESAQNNYTTTLHLTPLSPLFAQQNMANRKLHLEKMSDGSYRLRIV